MDFKQFLTFKTTQIEKIFQTCMFLTSCTIIRSTRVPGAAQEFWIDGFETSFREKNHLNFGNYSAKIPSFYCIFSQIEGFQNSSLKIDGFGKTPRTRANAAPVGTHFSGFIYEKRSFNKSILPFLPTL